MSEPTKSPTLTEKRAEWQLMDEFGVAELSAMRANGTDIEACRRRLREMQEQLAELRRAA